MPSKFFSPLPTTLHSRSRSLSAISVGILAGIGWLSLAVPQAMAGVTLVQHSSKDAGTSSSASLAFPANNSAGNWIGVVIRAGHSGQVLTVSDSRGNTYKQAVQFNQTLDAPNGETLAIYYAENIAGGVNTLTISESLANNTLRFAILEYSGLATSNSIDVASAAQGTGTTLSSGTTTTTAGGDLILGEVATASGVTFTAGSGYIIEERVPAAPNTKLIAEDAVQAAAGPVSVSATLSISGNGGALLAAFRAAGAGTLPPSITSLSPASGPVGTSIVIAGANFGASQGTSTVTFNGVAAAPSSWSTTSITVPVPIGATTGNLVVTVGGVPSNGLSFTVTIPAPSISNLNPTSGPTGTSVTVAGANFGATQGVSTVTFNGVAATPTSWSATGIVVPVPAGATTGNVVVTIGGIASNGVSFAVLIPPNITSLNPISGPIGMPVTITGANFGSTLGTVTFSGVAVTQGILWTPTSISLSVPAGASTGNVVVNAGGLASNGVAFTVTSTPVLISLNPTSGAVTTSVALSGAGFGATQGSTTVSFGGTLATPTFWSQTTILTRVPAGANSGNVVVAVGGLASNGVVFTVLPISVSVAPSTATVATSSTVGFGATVQNDVQNASVTWSLSGAGCTGAACGTFGATAGPAFATYTAPAVVPAPPTVTLTATSVADPTKSVSATITVTQAVPNITSLSPTSATVGTSVTISGANFGPSQGTSSVTFNGIIATPTSWSTTSIVVPVPMGSSTGNVVVIVGGAASSGTPFAVLPSISSFSPTSGPVGTSVTITGDGFGPTQGTSTVTFNGTPASPTSWSTKSIVAPVPSGATTGFVVVTVGGAATNTGGVFIVQPNISSLNPTTGTVGNLVTITGTTFGATQGTSQVTFNGIPAIPTSWSATSIIVLVPLAASTGNVVVTVGGGFAGSSNGVIFTVTPSPITVTGLSPSSGAVGTPVTIMGTGFGATQGTSTVSFNGTPATPTSWSSTSIVAPVPAGAVSGNVVVSVGGLSSNGVAFTVPPPPPIITSLNPVSGLASNSVTITGANFLSVQGAPGVSFNGVASAALSWTATSISSFVPNGATTGPVVVTAGGVASNGVNFTVIPPPNISSVSPTSAAVGAPVTITGTNFGASQGNSKLGFNGTIATPTSWSDTSIQVTVPTGATTGNVVVSVTGVGSNGVNFTVIPPPPSITSLSPSSGAVGALVLISGANFGSGQGTSTLTFNGTSAGSIAPTAWSSVSITAQVPVGATTGNVIVTVGGVASNSTAFTVTPQPAITSLSPTSGPVGTSFTIAGSNFGATQGTSAVIFNGRTASVTNWTGTSITATVPTGATTGNVVVDASGVISNGVLFTVTAPPPPPAAPTVASLTPPLGLVGTSVTITGTNFGSSQGASTVMFNGVAAVPTSWTPTSIVAPVPNGATTGNVFVTVGGLASNSSNFTVTIPPAPVALVQHTSKDAGSTSSSTLAFKSNNSVGNWIAVVARAGKSGQVFSVSDSLHNTYRTAAQFNVTVDTPNGDTLGIFYAENIAGGANTITVADNISGNSLRFAIFEYSGVAHANSLDGVIAGQGTNTSPNSGSVTTSINGDLLLGAAMTGGPATYTAGPGYKIEELVPAEPNTKLIAEDQIQAVAGMASASATLGASDHWGAILAAFKPGNGGITGPAIASLSPAFGPVGTSVTINGANFGSSQGASTISFNGTTAIPSTWSATSIVAPVPVGASTGTVVATVAGVASNGVTFTVTVPPPSIASLNPSSTLAGSGAFILTLNGANFVPASVIQWNGSARTTAFVSSTQLQAAITSADVAGASAAKVTVSNPGPGGAVSNPSAFFVGTSGGSNFAVLAVNQEAQDIVYDPKNLVFYLSVANNASSNPDTISVLDPTAAAIASTQLTGVNPDVLAISDDSQFLYVGIDGAASVQRYILPGLAPDISYALGSDTFGPYFALDLQVAPGAPHTTAVTLANSGLSPAAQGGILIFDDATSRSAKAPGGGNLFGSIQWGADATILYSSNTESTGFDFYTLSVNPGGVVLNQDFPGAFGRFGDKIHFDAGTNRIYSEEGRVIDPPTGLPVGNFNASGPMAVDSSLNTVFFLSGGLGGAATIQAFDLAHFTPIGAVTIPSVAGTLSHLIRWGQDGLAFISTGLNGSGQIFLVGGSFVGPAPAFLATPPPNPTIPPTPLPNAPTITSLLPSSAVAGSPAFLLNVTGTQFDPAAIVQFNGTALVTTFVSSTQLQATIPASDILAPGTASITVANPPATGGSSSGSTFFIGASGGFSSAGTGFAVQILNQASKDLAFDPVDQLFYLSVPNTNPGGNTIAVLDPSTTQIVGEQYAGSNPNVIAISDDGQFLYAGIDGSSSVQRFTLPTLSPDIRYSLGASLGPYFALDLQVAPAAPHTTAVTSGTFGTSPAAIGGISVFDDATMRPAVAKGFGPGGGGSALYDSLQWGSDATTLFAANNEDTAFDFYTLSINSIGVALTNDYPNVLPGFRDRIHFDSGTMLIYSDTGYVVNPSTGAPMGTFLLTGLVPPFVMVPDSNLNTGFFVARTINSSLVIYSFNLTTFAPISSILIPNVFGNPLRLVRWGQNGLAFNTDAGEIVLVGGNFVH